MIEKDIPIEVAQLLEEARRNTQPRKHHIVPASYLQRWAIQRIIRVHRLDESASHFEGPHTAARETDYYRVQSEDLDERLLPPMVFETILSRVEGSAVKPIDDLIAMRQRIDDQERYHLATFLAFQYARGHRTRLRIRATANEAMKLQTSAMSDENIYDLLANDGTEPTVADFATAKEAIQDLQDGKVVVVPQDAQAISLAFSATQVLAQLIFERPWMVATTHSNLITTDEPVVPIAGPGAPRAELSGIGAAGIVVFPLSPERVLLAFRKDLASRLGLSGELGLVASGELDLLETTELSRELVASAVRWAFERPDRNVVGRLAVPARSSDISVEEFEGSSRGSMLVRHFGFTRWQNADLVPDWPLRRFWPPDWRCLPLPAHLDDEIDAFRREQSELISDGDGLLRKPQ